MRASLALIPLGEVTESSRKCYLKTWDTSNFRCLNLVPQPGQACLVPTRVSKEASASTFL